MGGRHKFDNWALNRADSNSNDLEMEYKYKEETKDYESQGYREDPLRCIPKRPFGTFHSDLKMRDYRSKDLQLPSRTNLQKAPRKTTEEEKESSPSSCELVEVLNKGQESISFEKSPKNGKGENNSSISLVSPDMIDVELIL